jgi:uncharacterized glyoxalase superfamily metalloenzyme YdcJ
MARRKKPENETKDEAATRRQLEAVADHATRNEKVSWDRKMDNMVRLIAEITPIEEQISDLLAQKMPIMDKIQVLRNEMVSECVHPHTHLIHKGTHIECKFCLAKLALPQV